MLPIVPMLSNIDYIAYFQSRFGIPLSQSRFGIPPYRCERSVETQAPRDAPPEAGGAGIGARTCPLDSFDGLPRVLQ